MHKHHDDLALREMEIKAHNDFTEVHNAYIAFLQQNEKTILIKNVDLNTRIFHRVIKKRQLQNFIFGIHTNEGVWVEHPNDINDAFLSYYQKLLGSRIPGRKKVKSSIVHNGPLINEVQAARLLASFAR